MRPVAWTVAGSDSGGGAGLQADLLTMHRLGVHGCAVVTCLTAQSTREVVRVEPVSIDMLAAQFDALRTDLPPAAVKIGMLGTADVASCVADKIRNLDTFVVYDPVMHASTSAPLLEPNSLRVLVRDLLPRVDLLTPNVPEAEALLGRRIETEEHLEQAARDLCALGPRSVLLKGGHWRGEWSQDLWTDGRAVMCLTSPRRADADRHGTGCVLSAAVAAARALGYDMRDTLVIAKAYLNQGLRVPRAIGAGASPVSIGDWPADPADLPWITESAAAGRAPPAFPPMEDTRIGLYPIVDQIDMLRKLLPLGLTMVQLRIKDPLAPRLEEDVAEAISSARSAGVRLFINDHWKLAIKHGAYGVHLGQDDLDPVALSALREAGLRLGLSTHSYAEIARAHAVGPSYMAIGTVFRTTSKVMVYAPLGLSEFARLRALVACPVVAIGGMHLANAADVHRAGADGTAVISEIGDSPDVGATVKAWQDALALHFAGPLGSDAPGYARPAGGCIVPTPE